jgi:hypothetical protein
VLVEHAISAMRKRREAADHQQRPADLVGQQSATTGPSTLPLRSSTIAFTGLADER